MYKIINKESPEIECGSLSELRIKEAFFRGMNINYSIVYPSGIIMEVTFKETYMESINELDQKITRIKQQMKHLSEAKNISEHDRTDLRKYYENKLKSYTNRKDSLIKNIEVEAEILNPNEK